MCKNVCLSWISSVSFFWQSRILRGHSSTATVASDRKKRTDKCTVIFLWSIHLRKTCKLSGSWCPSCFVFFCLHIILQSSSVFKLLTWSLLRPQRLRMAFSNSDGYEPLASPLVEQKDRPFWVEIWVQWHRLSQHCLLFLLRTLFHGLPPSWLIRIRKLRGSHQDLRGDPGVSKVPVTTFTIVPWQQARKPIQGFKYYMTTWWLYACYIMLYEHIMLHGVKT